MKPVFICILSLAGTINCIAQNRDKDKPIDDLKNETAKIFNPITKP